MKTIRDFLRKHALLLLAALVVLSVPAGVALGKYVASETVTDKLNLNVSMKTYVLRTKVGNIIREANKLPNNPPVISICKHSELPQDARFIMYVHDKNKSTGEIGIYVLDQNQNVYIAPVDSDAVIYAPEDCTGLFEPDNLKDVGGASEYDLHNLDTSNVTNMSRMFYSCDNLINFTLTMDTSKVTDMSQMFMVCLNLQSIQLNFDTSNVLNMKSMFSRADTIKTIDISSFDTSNVTNMAEMFCWNAQMKKITVSSGFTTDKVTSSDNMFLGCKQIVGGNYTYFDSNVIDKTYARIDQPGQPGYFTAAPGTQSLINSVNVNVDSAYGFGVDAAA